MSRPEDAALGSRLREARTQAGYSQQQLAAALDIPRSAVSLIESGERSLASSELARLADVYGWPVDELLFGTEPDAVESARESGAILRYFRTAGAVAPSEHGTWLNEAETHWRRYAEVEQKVYGSQRWDLPTYRVPGGRPPEQGEHLAAQERRRLGLESAPIRSMIDLLESEGIKVLFMPFDLGIEIAGCYFFSEELGPCVLVNKSDPPARRRFTEGHEYCHFLVDREAVEGEICTPSRRRELFEVRANAFAAAFLLPERGIRDALEDADVASGEVGPENIVHLMQRFGASREAILWRLLNLRLLSAEQRKALSKFAVGDLRERLGYELEPGQSESAPDRYRRLAVEAWRMKQMPTKELAQVLDLPPRDVPKIFSIDHHHQRRSTRRMIEEPDWL